MKRFSTPLFLLSLVGAVVGASAQQPSAGVFADAAAPGAVAADATAMRRRWVTIDYAAISDPLAPGTGKTDLALNLFDDTRFIATLDRVEITDGGYVWIGRIPEIDNSSVMLAVRGSAVAGSVVLADATYAIRYVADDVHVVQQVNLAALPRELPPIEVDLPPSADAPPTMTDDGSTVDLLVVYTPAARSARGGTSAIQALIDLGVAETNQSYANSGAVQRLRLMNKQEIAYTEANDMLLDLRRLQATSDGILDSVHGLRDTYGADLVQLIVAGTEMCGIAYLMTTVNTSFAPYGFGVTHYSCISPNYSFAHELGHNMGLRHDVYMDSGTTPFAYSHGYINQAAFPNTQPASKRWRDIMAYNDQCANTGGFNCTRLLYFSNPHNTYTSDPMGNANTADAVRSLDNTRAAIANLRASITSLPQVSINNVSATEATSGTTTMNFTVSLSQPHSHAVTMNYATSDITALGAPRQFAGPGSITIATQGAASPYPSAILVPAGFGAITKVSVVLRGFSHTFPSNVDVLLIGPNGQSCVLMSDVGSGTDASNLTFAFDDNGPAMPTFMGTIASGTFAPTNYTDSPADSYPAPAPAGPYGSVLSVFNGSAAEGPWRLYVTDDGAFDGGSLTGWDLHLTTTVTDYHRSTGTLTIAPGSTSQSIPVVIQGDTAFEPTETFRLNLTNVAGGTFADSEGIGTILNRNFFTDDPLSAGTPIKAAHVAELRAIVNIVRGAKGLAAFSFTDPSLTAQGTIIKVVHIVELRTALAAAYAAVGQPAPTYADPTLTADMTARAMHITQLRNAAVNIP